VRFADLVAGRVVAVNFVFTTCTTSCPILGTNFGEVRRRLDDRMGKEFALVSVSVDPQSDTPERLKGWAGRFGGGPGWTLLTGPKDGVDRLLRALGAYTPDKTGHPSTILVIDGVNSRALRTSGLAAPADLVRVLEGAARVPASRPAPKAPSAARNYFTDTPLVTHDGREVRFYSDLIEGKTVVINVFFTSCPGSCLVMSKTLAAVQARLGGRLGKDAHLISISVDPEKDTPARLKAYAEQFGAKPGWVFLTGEKANVDRVLSKLGQYVENRDAHGSVLIVGNDRTGLWKKGFGLAGADKLTELVEGVLNDRGP
jgi:cytochrome oxidase Cu insertion factor (SCO1/SenC/PrrC family)